MTPTARSARPLGQSSTRLVSHRREHIGDISLTARNTPFVMPTQGGQLPNDFYLYGLYLQFEGRVTYAANGPTGVLADAPFSILDSIQISGYHRPRATQELFFNLRGPEIRELTRLYSSSVPLLTPASLTTGQVSNDIRFALYIPFTPLHLPVSQKVKYLLDAPNYNNLTMTVNMGDDFSIFKGQTAGGAVWTAFGGATGNPRIRVSRDIAMQVGNFNGFLPARVWRYHQEIAAGDIVNGATASRLYQLPRGYKLRSVLAKFGVKGATVTGGNNAYDTLSNSIANNIQVMRGTNRQIRKYIDMFALQQEIVANYHLQTAFETGYGLIDFAQQGMDAEVLDTAGMIAGPTGDTDLFLQADLTGAASQAMLFAVEEIRGAPAIPVRR